MTYEVQLTNAAEADLRDIFKYIAVKLQSANSAAGQLNRLEHAINTLSQMPERYRLYEKEPWRSRNLRIMPVDNYLIFYIPNRENFTVTVMRIMYAARDINSGLNANPHK